MLSRPRGMSGARLATALLSTSGTALRCGGAAWPRGTAIEGISGAALCIATAEESAVRGRFRDTGSGGGAGWRCGGGVAVASGFCGGSCETGWYACGVAVASEFCGAGCGAGRGVRMDLPEGFEGISAVATLCAGSGTANSAGPPGKGFIGVVAWFRESACASATGDGPGFTGNRCLAATTGGGECAAGLTAAILGEGALGRSIGVRFSTDCWMATTGSATS